MKTFRLLMLGLAWLGGTALAADTAPEPTYARRVPLWPEGSRVLQEGIDVLTGQPNAITHPELLLYPAKAPSSRAAVLVFPGGGFQALAIGPQSTIGFLGADVCGWLTDAGVTCFLVKYRVPDTACNWNPETRRHQSPAVPMALQDTQRAVSLVRHRAKEFGIDPGKIGVLGFSAGGYLAVLSSTQFDQRAYAPIDGIDRTSSRPDFAIPVYPGHLTMEHKNKTPKDVAARELNTDIDLSPEIPPTLLIHAMDDPVDPVHYSQVYERELDKAGVDVRLNLYPSGGHAFGVRKQGAATDRWTDDALAWLREKNILPANALTR